MYNPLFDRIHVRCTVCGILMPKCRRQCTQHECGQITSPSLEGEFWTLSHVVPEFLSSEPWEKLPFLFVSPVISCLALGVFRIDAVAWFRNLINLCENQLPLSGLPLCHHHPHNGDTIQHCGAAHHETNHHNDNDTMTQRRPSCHHHHNDAMRHHRATPHETTTTITTTTMTMWQRRFTLALSLIGNDTMMWLPWAQYPW